MRWEFSLSNFRIMKAELKNDLKNLFKHWSGKTPTTFEALPAHGSAREYYRLKSGKKTAIGTFNQDHAENIAFLTFSKHFHSTGLPVPEIYAEERKKNIYLQEDLGDTTLFSFCLDF